MWSIGKKDNGSGSVYIIIIFNEGMGITEFIPEHRKIINKKITW